VRTLKQFTYINTFKSSNNLIEFNRHEQKKQEIKQQLREAELKGGDELKKMKLKEEELSKQEKEFKQKEEELKKKEKVN
jgi:hypothetical protein